MIRQFLTGLLAFSAAAPIAWAQVPPLPLPPLPAPGQALPNPELADNPATVEAPPPLAFDLQGPEDIGLEPEPEPKVLPNPTDLLPDTFLEQADVPQETATTASDADKDNGGEETATAATEPATDTEQDTGQEDKKTAEATPPALPPAGLTLPPTGALPLPSQAASDINPPPPAAVTRSRTGRRLPPSRSRQSIFSSAPATAPLPKLGQGEHKTWQQPLAPARTYPKTNFNYRYVALPDSIYREKYDRFNQHLPKKQSSQTYDLALLRAAASNDINGVRALLNQGSNVNQINAYGDSALIIALKYGAVETARLLIARGANPDHIGQNGRNAFYYASRLRAPELVKALTAQSRKTIHNAKSYIAAKRIPNL